MPFVTFWRDHLRSNLGIISGLGIICGAVQDTLLLMMFLGLRKLGNICCGHKMFLNKIRNIFCVPDTKFVSAANVARAGERGNRCVGNNVSSFCQGLMQQFEETQHPSFCILFAQIYHKLCLYCKSI